MPEGSELEQHPPIWCSIVKKNDTNKQIKHFPKMFRDVGMAVPKTTETRCRDRAYKHCTYNPSLHLFLLQVTSLFDCVLRLLETTLCMKKEKYIEVDIILLSIY